MPAYNVYPNSWFKWTQYVETNAQAYFYWLQIVIEKLLAAPNAWVCRGSSRNGGSLGTTYTATPTDGADLWSGKTFAQISNGSSIWYVIESPAGFQVCFSYLNTTGYFHAVYALNKFETGGAWRNAVAAGTRPKDIDSPIVDQREFGNEIAVALGGQFVSHPSLGTMGRYVHVMKRTDGYGFWTMLTAPSLDRAYMAVAGIGRMANPISSDPNPNMILAAVRPDESGYLSRDTPPSNGYIFMPMAGSSTRHVAVRLGTQSVFVSGSAGNTDLYTGRIFESPVPVFTSTTKTFDTSKIFTFDQYRGCLPDVARVSDWPQAQMSTFNSKQRICFGGYSFPWDGFTEPRFTT